MLTGIALYAFGRSLFGPTGGLTALLFFALSPTHIRYSQEIRMYALMFLLAVLSMHAFAAYVRSKNPVHGALHLLANSALAWTHLLSPLLFVSQGAYLVLCRPLDRRRTGTWILAHVAIGIGIACWLATLDTTDLKDAVSWVREARFRQLMATVLLTHTYAGESLEHFRWLDWSNLFPLTVVAFWTWGLMTRKGERQEAGVRRQETGKCRRGLWKGRPGGQGSFHHRRRWCCCCCG